MEVVTLNEQLREQFAGVVKQFMAIRREEIARVAVAQIAVPGMPVQIAPTTAAATPNPPSHDDHSTSQPETEPSSKQIDADAKPPTSPSSAPPSSATPAPPFSPMDDQTKAYTALARAILLRTNTYQYLSRDHFIRDITQLSQLATYHNQKLILSHLLNQQQELAKRATETPPLKRIRLNGIRVDAMGMPGLQPLPDGTVWRCNISMEGNLSTIARCSTKDKAITEYKELRESLRQASTSMKMLHDEARPLARARTKLDRSILADAMKQVKQRIPIHKLHDVNSLMAPTPPPVTLTPTPTPTVAVQSPTVSQQPQQAAAPANTTTTMIALPTKDKDSKPSKKRELVVDTSNSSTSSTTTCTGKGTTLTPASATPELMSQRTPTDQASRVRFLRLRRLMQIRLCHHLEGREVCVFVPEEEGGKQQQPDWTPVGRLEKAKVWSYATKTHETFSDFVATFTEQSVAACSHLYVVETKETIDSHLLVCDQFDDNVRALLGRNFKEVSEKYRMGKLS